MYGIWCLRRSFIKYLILLVTFCSLKSLGTASKVSIFHLFIAKWISSTGLINVCAEEEIYISLHAWTMLLSLKPFVAAYIKLKFIKRLYQLLKILLIKHKGTEIKPSRELFNHFDYILINIIEYELNIFRIQELCL